MVLSLSTSWASGRCDTGDDLLRAIERQQIAGVELEYRITEKMFRQMRGPLKQSGLQVTSIHNYFPHPADMDRKQASGDLFLLSAPDPDERKRAINATARSIEHANDMEAKVIILHCGHIEMNPEKDRLREYFTRGRIDTEEAQTFIARKLAEREGVKGKFVDALLDSLDRLIRVAERENIVMGLENRAHYDELPGISEFETIFREFRGGPVAYWHDTGHAHSQEVLTILPRGALLNAYGEQLVGFHLHDAAGFHDHQPPGQGDIDFDLLKPCLKPETLRVIELKPGTAAEDVAETIRFFRKNGFDGDTP